VLLKNVVRSTTTVQSCQPLTRPCGYFPGGFHVAFADTEVWFLDNDIPRDLLAKFCTIEGAKELDRDEVLGEWRLR
jgi:hypothetical protein